MNMKMLKLIKLIGPTFITNRFNNVVSMYSFICLFVFLEAFILNINAQTAGDYYRMYENSISKGDYSAAYDAIVKCDKLVGSSQLSSTIIGIMLLQGQGVPMDSTRAYIDGFSKASYAASHKSDESRKKSVEMYENMDVEGVDMKDISKRIQQSWIEEDEQYNTYMKLDNEQTNILSAFAFRWNACYSMTGVDAAVISGDLEERFAGASEVIEEASDGLALTEDGYLLYLLGKIWYEGHTGMKDRQKGIGYFEKSASKGCISALTYIGDIMANKGDIDKAKEYWKKAAKESIKPLILPTKQNVMYFISPNIDLYDVKSMKERAIDNLKRY